MAKKALVKNAASKKQVKNAESSQKFVRENELIDVKEVLSTVNGRRFLWRVLNHCKVFSTIWHSSALIHYNSGMQDVGHFIMSEINDADSDLLFKMMKENKEES